MGPAVGTYGENPAFFHFDVSGAHLHYVNQFGDRVKAPYKDWSLPSPVGDVSPSPRASVPRRTVNGSTPYAACSRLAPPMTASPTPQSLCASPRRAPPEGIAFFPASPALARSPSTGCLEPPRAAVVLSSSPR